MKCSQYNQELMEPIGKMWILKYDVNNWKEEHMNKWEGNVILVLIPQV